ncbi:PIN domain nuclease [Actinoplanes subtropicus]|uniref:PIN domain nuclease n=1 Tax=Actinoplanes subtropicus TaxID=543632 RepID=UPI0004C43DF2|nr:PIN domain nuclease [Actinoplanes subtropicus]
MRTNGFLVDTSAFVRLVRDSELRATWREAIGAGVLSVCPLTELEVLRGAQSMTDRQAIESVFRRSYCWVVMPDRAVQRAQGVQEGMTTRGTHRSASPVDLLVAATAEAHGLTLLHYDHDFVRVAAVTGQKVRWLAEPGSIN